MKRSRLVLLISLIVVSILTLRTLKKLNFAENLTGHTAAVKHIIDGDTIVIDYQGRKEKARLIGINTPEIHHPEKGIEPYGYEAKRFVEGILKAGDTIRIEF